MKEWYKRVYSSKKIMDVRMDDSHFSTTFAIKEPQNILLKQ